MNEYNDVKNEINLLLKTLGYKIDNPNVDIFSVLDETEAMWLFAKCKKRFGLEKYPKITRRVFTIDSLARYIMRYMTIDCR